MKMLFRVFSAVSTLILAATAQTPFVLKHSIAPPPGVQQGEGFGSSVVTSGGFTAVSAPRHSFPGEDVGIVKVFDSATGAVRFFIENPAGEDDDYFGAGMVMSGTRLAVATYSSQAVYVFDLAGATPTVPVATLHCPRVTASHFGGGLAMDGTRVVVSNPYGYPEYGEPSEVYVFDIATPNAPIATIAQVAGGSGQPFGAAVAISGNRVVVGDWGYDSAFYNIPLPDLGRAYVYNLASATPSTPALIIEYPGANIANAHFARSVALSGNRLLIASPYDNGAGVASGAVWEYNLGSSTPTVPVSTIHKPSGAAGDAFGWAMALSGSRAVIAPMAEIYANVPVNAFVFDLAGATPTVPTTTFSCPVSENLSFAQAFSISGTKVVIGNPLEDFGVTDAGRAYSYNLPSTTPMALDGRMSADTDDGFGDAVALSGSLMAVGSRNGDHNGTDTGTVAIYNLASATPLVAVTILDIPSATGARFGEKVVFKGSTLVVGAPGFAGGGAVYVYQITPEGYYGGIQAILQDAAPEAEKYFGAAIAMDGSRIVVGAEEADVPGHEDAGRVFVYDFSVSTATPVLTLDDPAPSGEGYFGRSVAISGNRIVVGASREDSTVFASGVAYVFDLASATPSVPVATLNSPSPSNEDDFGHAVAIIGSKVIVSAFADDTGGADAGRVFVFELASGTPVLGHTLNDPQPMEGDYFGISLCSEGNRVIVGAFRDTVQSVHSGGAFVYDLGGSTPSIPVATLRDPVPSVSHFGFSVAMNSQSVAVGAPSSNIAGTSNGYAYVFGPGSANTAPSVTLTGNNPLTFEAAATYTDPGATAGDAEDGALVPVITSNTVIANVPGTYSVTWTATDSGGLTGSTTRTVNVVDTTPPSIDGDAFFPTTIPVSSLLPDYRGQERSHDAVGVVSTTQSPAPGAYIGRGRLFVNIAVADAAGNTNSVTFSVIAEGVGRNVLVVSGGEVPNVGNDPRIPAGAVWAGFGSPVINEGGYVAFLGKWTSPDGKGAGIFSDDTEGTPRLEVKVGDPVPDVPGAVWRTLSDPVYAYPGNVAWIGKISGPGITSANDTAVGTTVWSLGTLLREGQSLPVVGGARVKSVRNIAINSSFGYVKVFMDVALATGSGAPATTTANDRAVLTWTHEDGFAVVFREGDRIGEGAETIRSYVCLDSIPGSPGHGRGIANYGAVSRWTTSSGRQIAVGPDGRFIAETDGSLFNTMPGALWSKVGIPSLELNTAALGALKGTLKTGLAGVTAENATGIFFMDDAGGLPIARTSQAAPGIGGATFSSFLDPVGGGGFGDGKAAFIATVRGSGVTSADNQGIWLGGRTPLRLIAREGAQPPGAPAGAKWKAFTSLAMPRSIGPIFTATLQQGVGGITSADDIALYGVGSEATLFELLREGQTLDGKVVQNFTVLAATLGSQGTTRHFTSDGRIIARVEFTDRSSALVALFVP